MPRPFKYDTGTIYPDDKHVTADGFNLLDETAFDQSDVSVQNTRHKVDTLKSKKHSLKAFSPHKRSRNNLSS